jgi:hypothetical protein
MNAASPKTVSKPATPAAPKAVAKAEPAATPAAPKAVAKAEPAATKPVAKAEPAATKPEIKGDANPFKYDARDAKRKSAAAQCSPGWSLTNAVLTVGKNRPTRDNSVKGKIYGLVSSAGRDGLTGAELVVKMRESALFADNPSKYTKNGMPVVPWCEDYILGMTRPRFGFLNVKHAVAAKTEEEPAVAKKAA